MTVPPEHARRDLAHWNASRHGWDHFQASSRSIAQRIARTADTKPDTARAETPRKP